MFSSSLSKILDFFSKFNLLDNGYNFLNTITYSVIGIFIYFFLVYPYLLFRKIKINLNFILSVLSFVTIGSLLRMFALDYTSLGGIISLSGNPFSLGFYFYYPHLFLFLGFFFLIFLEFSLYFSKKLNISSESFLFYLSLIFLFPLLLLFFINLQNIYFIYILILSIIIYLILFYAFRLFKTNFLKNKVTSLALFSQILDSSTTFFPIVFLNNNFVEIHVISKIIISISPYFFIIIKILFCLFLLYLIDKYILDSSLNNYFKLFIIVLGFSTGLRNLFLISLAFI